MDLKNVNTFHKLKHLIPQLVRETIDNKEIIHGARAINIQVASQHLKTQTRDFDVYSQHPQQSAIQTEKHLDKQFGHDAFETKKGINPGTYKVKARATGKTYVDYTKSTQKIPSRKILGKRYATLEHQQQHAQRTLKAGTATHRKQQDIDIVNRIKINKQRGLKW